jgi:hypothetical protein
MVEPLARRVAEMASGHVFVVAATDAIDVRVNTRTHMLFVVRHASSARAVEDVLLVVPLHCDALRTPFNVHAENNCVCLKHGIYGGWTHDVRKVVLFQASSAADATAIASALARALMHA